MTFSGGYYLFSEPLVRGFGPNSHSAKDLSKVSQYTIDAVNHIQDTPWAVNGFTLDVIEKLRSIGEDVGFMSKGKFETVLHIEQPMDPRFDPINVINLKFPAHIWQDMTKEQKQLINASKAKVMGKFEEDNGVYRATQRIMNEANEMSQFEHFYYPHNTDFRYRIYPIPNDLTPQSNDLSKGLLRFARGTRLGKVGLYWMGVTVASQWGEDKLSMRDRFEFAKGMIGQGKVNRDIHLWVDDPVNNRGWLEADSPFQFLAVAHEWVWAHRQDDPEAFVSFLPGNLDGSCNGAQHLSIMARDMVGAKATNCTKSSKREDLYMEVGNRVWARIEADIKLGNPVSIDWGIKMMDPTTRRGVVKRSVMTVPYGVTEYGVADFMIKDKHVSETAPNQWDAAKYMRDLIMDSINETLDRGRSLQFWFQACAIKCAEAGLPICWDTPAGSKVTQAYRNIVQKRIRCFDTRFVIYAEPEEGEEDFDFYSRVGMDVKKMGTSAPPNVVHSCDAAHLQITVCRMAEAGIRDFSMIHDSYGCPFAQVELMRDILRQSAVDMYKDDYLQIWKASVEKYSGLTMPDAPTRGTFDIMEILESEYFFS